MGLRLCRWFKRRWGTEDTHLFRCICRPVSCRLITIRLRAVSLKSQQYKYAPTSDYDDNEIEEFCDQLQNTIDQTPKKDILMVQGEWNAKVGKDAYENWQGICGPFCNDDTNKRGLRHLEFATLTILCWRTLLVITKHPEDGPGVAQMDDTTRLITF